MRILRRSVALVAIGFLCASAAGAATIAVTVVPTIACRTGDADGNNNEGTLCSQDGTVSDDWGSGQSSVNATSPILSGTGSTSATPQLNMAVAADDGQPFEGDRWIEAVNTFSITIQVDVDTGFSTWTVDLGQALLGLYGFAGDDTASAIGNQDDGIGRVISVLTTINGNPYNFNAAPTSASQDASNTNTASTVIGGSKFDAGVLSGSGDGVFLGSFVVELEALSNDGCSGIVCSSLSGGEEAAVLLGQDNVMADGSVGGGVGNETVDNYSFWGRSVTPDGLNPTFTLNVTFVPEPGTFTLLGLGLAGLAALRRRA